MWDTYWYEKNLQGDIIAIYSASGTQLVTYKYDAWGKTTVTYSNNGANTTAVKNNLTYRGYYYDSDLDLYHLQTRYYDPVICRFINADGYLSTGQGLTGYNMFVYCGNNPVMYVDYIGRNPIAIPLAYMYTGVIILALCSLFYDVTHDNVLGNAFVDAVNYIDNKIDEIVESKRDEEHKDIVIDNTPTKDPAHFTINPHEFKPNGLTEVEYPGTKNGKIIKWIDPKTSVPVFEWDEDPKFGPHYHILIDGKHTGDHYLPGMVVPEPWNSMYFGGKDDN